MQTIHIINGHQPSAFAPGRLNASLVDRARAHLAALFPHAAEASHVAA